MSIPLAPAGDPEPGAMGEVANGKASWASQGRQGCQGLFTSQVKALGLERNPWECREEKGVRRELERQCWRRVVGGHVGSQCSDHGVSSQRRARQTGEEG